MIDFDSLAAPSVLRNLAATREVGLSVPNTRTACAAVLDYALDLQVRVSGLLQATISLTDFLNEGLENELAAASTWAHHMQNLHCLMSKSSDLSMQVLTQRPTHK